ncbi:MAG: RrF2 family transcriptional regulator [Anaerovoracaceae bacterium]|jgi:Rrf2 family nitric oxide-sensitive transcriptional repressor
MQLNISTDYAIRIMLMLVDKEDPVNARQISEDMKVPINTCKKNLQLLKNAGLVKSNAGVAGGYFLGRDPDKITIRDIGEAMGENLILNRCLEPDCFCNRDAVEACTVRKIHAEAQKAFDKAFGTTLRQLAYCEDEGQ